MAVSVLVVEDDKNIAELLQMYLEKEGYAVTVANGTVSWGTNSERSYFLNADGTKYFWFAVG